MNGEETLNGRKDGNNSGRTSSRKERFLNLYSAIGYKSPKEVFEESVSLHKIA